MATSLRPTLAEVLAREYRFEVIPDAEGGYVIRYPELPGCMTQVESLEEVPAAAREIRELWLETEYERNGEPADGTATDEGRPPAPASFTAKSSRTAKESRAAVSDREEPVSRFSDDTRKVLEWVRRADLMRIDGVGSEYSDLLEAVGIRTVTDLSESEAEELSLRIQVVNGEKGLVRRTPSVDEVRKWVVQARSLPRRASY